MSGRHEPKQNHFLNALLPAARERWYPHLELVAMPLGKVLYESGDVLRHVYFPTASLVRFWTGWGTAHRRRSQWWGTKVSSELRYSWVVKLLQAARSYRVLVMPTGWLASSSRTSFIATVRCRYCCCVTRKR